MEDLSELCEECSVMKEDERGMEESERKRREMRENERG